jgi:hypothetical protein
MPTGLHGPRAKTSRQRIAKCKHATEVMRLRLSGLSHDQIGERLGFSAVRAFQICKAELGRLNAIRTETAEEMQRLEVLRLDQLLSGVWQKAIDGNPVALGRALDILTRRAKLLGLDLADRREAVTAGQVVVNVTEVLISPGDPVHAIAEQAPADDGPPAPGGEAPQGPAAIPAE